MRIKHITVISLILIAASGCQKKGTPAAAAAEETPVTVTEAPPSETPTATAPLTAVQHCPPINPILIDSTNPGGSGISEICVFCDGTNSGAVLTWNWKAASAKKFKVEYTGFVPVPPAPTTIVYPYNLTTNCPGNQNSCVSGQILTSASEGTYYYKVTTIEANPQVFNGRIIIDR